MNNDAPTHVVENWRELARRLIYGTKIGKLDWDDGPRKESIITSINAYVVVLEKSSNDYYISISNELGDVVDVFSDEQINPLGPDLFAYAELDRLYKTVRRKLNGADEVLNALLKELPEDPGDTPF